jgi:hypothetical protein
MPIIIKSKNIFSVENEKFTNAVKDALIEETAFSTNQAEQMFSINLECKRIGTGLSEFGKSEGYQNIVFFQGDGDYNRYVQFSFETELDEKIFLLRNAKVKLSLIGEEYNPNNIDDDENGSVDDNEYNDQYSFTNSYDSEIGSDIYFSILEKEEYFKSVGVFATVGIYRLSRNRAKMFVVLPYYYDDSYSYFTRTYKRAEIYLCADEQINNYVGENGSLLQISNNELINETTIVSETTKTPSETPTWFLKIKQSSDFYGSGNYYYFVNDKEERASFISSGIGTTDVRFFIYNFYSNTNLSFSEETISKLQNCKIECNGVLISASVSETTQNMGDGSKITVNVSDEEWEKTEKTLSEFRGAEKTFYFGYSAGGEEITTTEKISEFIRRKVVGKWQKGKESAKMRCSISDYYDENGEKVIDIKSEKMSFNIGDNVIPMVFGENRIDRPMSKNADGSAKVFRVCGIKFIYDGAVWQELTLQEV